MLQKAERKLDLNIFCIFALYFKVLLMEEKEKYLEDIKEIKDIMNRSSRFISLSGLSGVSTGIIALLGAYLAYQTVYASQDYLGYRKVELTEENLTMLLGIVILVLVLSIASSTFFTIIKAKRVNQKLWDAPTKLLIANLLIPLVSGGILCLILLLNGYLGLVAPLTLIFYGLALVNASKFTLHDIRSLGILEIALGLIATHFIGFGLLFWAIGFGLLHIIYGIIMHVKYGS